jgi:hypothetical protein
MTYPSLLSCFPEDHWVKIISSLCLIRSIGRRLEIGSLTCRRIVMGGYPNGKVVRKLAARGDTFLSLEARHYSLERTEDH